MGFRYGFVKSLSKLAPVAFGTFDLYNDRLICSSGLAEKLLGYSKKELIALSQNTFSTIIHPEDLVKSKEAVEKLIKSEAGEIVESTFRVRKSDGQYLCLYVRDIVYERSKDNQPLKFATVVQDISEFVELEKELAKKVEILNEISLKNSHEVRGPVATILGLGDLMKRDGFKTEYHKKMFDHLEKTVIRLDNVIRDIDKLSY